MSATREQRITREASTQRSARRVRGRHQLAADVASWTVALALGAWARYDFQARDIDARRLAAAVGVAAAAQALSGIGAGLYIGRWRFASFDEVAALARAAVLTFGAVFAAANATNPHLVPLGAVVFAFGAALLIMLGSRYVWRLVDEQRRRPAGSGVRPLLVFGAGEGGAQAVTAMLRDPDSPWVPVALIDDDPRRRNLRMSGVAVAGARDAISETAQRTGARDLLIAIPSASGELIAQVSELAVAAGLRVKTLPRVSELLGEPVSVGDIRPVTESDLLGRRETQVDLAPAAARIAGRRVLVTGAGGSIGSELCRQLARLGPAELVMLDRDESALLNVKLSIDGRGSLEDGDLVLADVSDEAAVERILSERRPHVVFHAAALKHVPMLERHPAEAYRANVLATLHLLDAAARHDVERFVNVSTDKAADPVNALGYSKRIGERLTAWYGRSCEACTCISVRFGNVLGSRGSMLGTFKAQVDAGGPLTVTHPDVTRYFMTIEEAVRLVLLAAAIGSDGEVLVLDMGKPVRIADVALVLARQQDPPVPIEFTGLRAGEKLEEVLVGRHESIRRTVHPLIWHVVAPPLAPEAVRTAPAQSVEALRALSQIPQAVVLASPSADPAAAGS